MEYTHKGIKITFEASRATFYATVGTVNLHASSLTTIKKKIDAEKAFKFEPFDALYWNLEETFEIRIVRVDKGDSRWNRNKMVFVPGEGAPHWIGRQLAVTLNTPEARKLIKEYQRVLKEGEAEKKRIDKRIAAAKDAIPRVSADDYGTK